MIPILEILFETSKDVVDMVPWAMNLGALKHNLYYYISVFKTAHGAGFTLLFVGLFVIIATMLKVGFYYLGAYEAVYIRNGVVKDIREQIFSKMLKLALPFFFRGTKRRYHFPHNRRRYRSGKLDNVITGYVFEKPDNHPGFTGFNAGNEPKYDTFHPFGTAGCRICDRTCREIIKKGIARRSGQNGRDFDCC